MNDPYRPPPPVYFPQTADEKNLGLLATFHYVVGAFIALFSSVFLMHVVMGIVMLTSPESMGGSGGGQPPPPFLGAIFLIMGSLAVLAGWSVGACIIFAGRCLNRRVRHTFCLVAAGLACLWMPFGTVLGVFAFITLSKPHIRGLFT